MWIYLAVQRIKTKKEMWPRASGPSSQRVMGLTVPCWDCLHLWFSLRMWERQKDGTENSREEGQAPLWHPLLGSNKHCPAQMVAHAHSYGQLMANPACSARVMWLPTATATSDSWPAASWAYTENVLLLSCRCTRRFTWTVSSFRTMKSSSVSGTDSCPGQSVKTTVGKGGKEYQEGGGFWRLPHGNQDLTTAPWLDQGLFQATAEGDLTYFIWPAVWPKMSFRWAPKFGLEKEDHFKVCGTKNQDRRYLSTWDPWSLTRARVDPRSQPEGEELTHFWRLHVSLQAICILLCSHPHRSYW